MTSRNLATLHTWRPDGRLWAVVVLAGLAAVGCKKEAPPAEVSAAATAAAASALPALPPPAPGTVRVVVTEEGFQPTRVELKKGEKVVFRRLTDNTCAKDVVFPALKIEKPLPLNTDVAIDLPESASGELDFQCGMAMYKSKLVVN